MIRIPFKHPERRPRVLRHPLELPPHIRRKQGGFIRSTGPTLPAPGADPYDMSGFSIPYTVVWPNAPSPAGTSTPSNFSELSAAIAAGNATITPAPGRYPGNLTSWGDDIVLVLGPDVILDGNWAATGSARVKVTSGHVLGHHDLTDCDDWLFDGVHFNGDDSQQDIINMIGRMRRIAAINCTVWSSNHVATWAFHTTQTDNGNGIEFRDITLANCRLDSSAGFDNVVRLNAETLVHLTIVDTIFNGQQGCGSGHRFMTVTDSFIGNVVNLQFIMANWLAGSLTDTAIDGGEGGLTTDNLAVYDNLNIVFLTVGVSPGLIEGTISNSRLHKSGGGTPTFDTNGFDDGGGNDAVSWDGSSDSIDFSRMPGKTSISDYGADTATNMIPDPDDFSVWDDFAGGATLGAGATYIDGTTLTRFTRIDGADDGKFTIIDVEQDTDYFFWMPFRNVDAAEWQVDVGDESPPGNIGQLSVSQSGATPTIDDDTGLSDAFVAEVADDAWIAGFWFNSGSNSQVYLQIKCSGAAGTNGEAIDFGRPMMGLGSAIQPYRLAA